MRIVYIKLIGYAGIWTGLGLHELELDLSKSKHKIIVISGINGCGKSTLLKALNGMPDDSSCFREGMPGTKILHIEDNDNLYEIKITSGKKMTSKAYISKNGIALNPNGNITSYKEVFFNEFELDPNYIALSMLSENNRGLADMTPGERKKFMSFIIESLGSYNEIYKVLNKKSSIFKSYVNNLHNKIQMAGDENNIISTIDGLKKRKEVLQRSIDEYNERIIESQTILKMNSVENISIERIKSLETSKNNLQELINKSKEKLDQLVLSVDMYIEPLQVYEDCLKREEAKRDSLLSLKLEVQKTNTFTIQTREGILLDIENHRRKISSLSEGIQPELENKILALENKIENEQIILSELGIVDIDNTSVNELKTVFDTINNIIDMITIQLYSDITENDVYKLTNNDIKKLLGKTYDKLSKYNEMLQSAKKRYDKLCADRDIMKILLDKPSNCTILDCKFISKAVCVETEYRDCPINKRIDETEVEMKMLESYIERYTELQEHYKLLMEKFEILNNIRNLLKINKSILAKCKIGIDFIESFEYNIGNFKSFNEFRNLEELISKINTLAIYKQDVTSLKLLKASYDMQSNSVKIVEELKNELENMQGRIATLDEEIKRNLDLLKEQETNLDNINDRISKFKVLVGECKNHIELSNNYEKVTNELVDISTKNEAYIQLLDNIDQWSTELNKMQTELKPIEEQISSLENRLSMLNSYKVEYNMYKEKYDLVDIIKKHCSPTSGIQTIFMDLYMNKTLDLTNQIIRMVFEDRCELLPFNISPDEFNIPFMSNGIPVNDISFGSTSQVCMIGMAISLVLLYQASAKYNIPTLDEVDRGLDSHNRMRFIPAIYKICDILGIDQLFMISHSLELELDNVDRIILKSYDNEIPEGNILYNYGASQH